MTTATRGSEPPEVYRNFGEMEFWGFVKGAPTGSRAMRASELLAIINENDPLPASRWPIAQPVVRAMTLELAASFAVGRESMTGEMLKLLAWAIGVPAGFLHDPVPTYSGHDGKGQGVELNCHARARYLDTVHLYRSGKGMSENALARAVGVDRKTIRAWRGEPGYQETAQRLAIVAKTQARQAEEGGSSTPGDLPDWFGPEAWAREQMWWRKLIRRASEGR